MLLGLKIRNLRKERKLTQRQLAKKAGISNTFLSDIERGRSNPSLKTLHRIAAVLEVEPYLLIAGDEQGGKKHRKSK